MDNIWSKRSNGFMQDLMKAAEFEFQNVIQQSEKIKATTLEQDLIDTNSKNVSIEEKDNSIEYMKMNPIQIDIEDSSKGPCSPDTKNLIAKSNKSSENLEKQILSENVTSVIKYVPLSSKKRKIDDIMEEICINDTKRCKGDNIEKEILEVENKIEVGELSESEVEFEDKILTMSSFFHILDIPGVSCQEDKDAKEISKDEFQRYNNNNNDDDDDDDEDSVKIKIDNSFLYNEEKAKEPPDSIKFYTFSKKLKYPEFSNNELTFSNKFITKYSEILPENKESPGTKDIFKNEDILDIFNTEALKHKKLEELVLKCYECHICFEEFKYSKVLLQHIECHGIDKYQCLECNYCSMDVLEFYRHRAVHTDTKPFTCNLCNYETVLMEELTEHVLFHYEKAYECNMCFFTSRLKEELDEHIKTHDKEIELEEHRILIDDSLHFQENILWQFSKSPHKNYEFTGSLKNDSIIPEKGYCRLTPIKNESPNKISRPCIQNNLYTISCDICDYKCNKKSHLDMHMIAHSGDRKYKCTLCAYSCRKKQNLSRHMEKHIDEKYLKCSVCAYKSHKKFNFERHLATHAMHIKEKAYNYKNSYSRDQKDNFTKPLVITNNSNKNEFEVLFRCKECSLACNSNIDLILHRLGHSQYFRCKECNYKSNKKIYIVKHLQKHTNKYKDCNNGCNCSKCEYCIHKKTELDRHTLIHNRKKTHECNQCQFAFRRISDLKRHIMTHTGEKPFKCTECNYATSRSHSLRLHETLRHSAKLYNCSKCEYDSKSAKDLKVHKKTCKKNPLTCHHCNYICNKKAELNRHLKVHKKSYKCNLCDYGCAQNSELKMHMSNIHSRKVSKSSRKSKLKKLKSIIKKNINRNKINR